MRAKLTQDWPWLLPVIRQMICEEVQRHLQGANVPCSLVASPAARSSPGRVISGAASLRHLLPDPKESMAAASIVPFQPLDLKRNRDDDDDDDDDEEDEEDEDGSSKDSVRAAAQEAALPWRRRRPHASFSAC